mgnify:CR=1 FL=1
MIKDLYVRGALEFAEYISLADTIEAFRRLPSDKCKALGVQSTMSLPGGMYFIQCRDGQNTLKRLLPR